jgi:hypothetical protein
MGKKQALQEVDPLSLPVGLRVGPWRVKGWRGRGAYGTLYRVEREGREAEGEFALNSLCGDAVGGGRAFIRVGRSA